MQSPFKLFEPYGTHDKHLFFGRDAEVYALYNLLQQTRLVLVYGASGTGKTSLLQAGLPKVFKLSDWFRISVRRRDDLNASLRAELERLGEGAPVTDLAAGVEAAYEARWIPLYLVFDQFEELFTLGHHEERVQFFRDLQTLLERPLLCKIVLSMREEYIGHLYEYEPLVPSLFDKRFRVEPMKDETVRQVVLRTCEAHGVTLAEGATTAGQILEQVKEGKQAAHLPYLQVYLHYLYEHALQTTGQPRFEAAAIQTLNLLGATGLGEKTPGAQAKLRLLIKAASPPDWYAVLEDRYYPKMIRVDGGSFLREDDSVRVKVSAFQIAESETTFWQYGVFAKAKHHYIAPPSWQYAGDNPAVNVSWYDAVLYANWLGACFQRKPVYTLAKIKENRYNVDLIDNIVGGYRVDSIDYTVGGYRLPTEAEWEFAARGGNQSKGFEYSGDPILTNVGWYDDNSNSRTHAVRQKKANELELYDMSGNVWEWCNDWYNLGYDPKITENPRGPDEGNTRVLRGGSWISSPRDCRTAYRYFAGPDYRYYGFGFRLALQ